MTVTRLVEHGNPDGRGTPLLLLGALREIDPTVELVYFGARDWRLGAVRTGQARDFRAKQGDRMLDALDRVRASGIPVNPKNLMLAHLLKQGFAQIAQYTDFGDVSGVVRCMTSETDGYETTILHDFRERDFHWRRDQGEAVVHANALAAADGAQQDADRARMNDYLTADGRDHYRREVRGRVTFGYGGMTGGGGRVLTPFGERRHKPIITGDQVLAEIATIMAELGAGA